MADAEDTRTPNTLLDDAGSSSQDTASLGIPAFLSEHILHDARMHGRTAKEAALQKAEAAKKHLEQTEEIVANVAKNAGVKIAEHSAHAELEGTDAEQVVPLELDEVSYDPQEDKLVPVHEGTEVDLVSSDIEKDTGRSADPLPEEALGEGNSPEVVGIRNARDIVAPLSSRARYESDVIDVKQHMWLLLAVFGAAVLLFGWIATSFHGCNNGFVDEQLSAVASRAQDKAAAEAEAEAAAAQADEEKAKADEELKAGLVEIYQDLPNLEAELNQAFADFDLYFLQRRVVREPYSYEVTPIAERLNEHLSKLDHIKVVNTSDYREQATNVRNALNALIQRADALSKAWEEDLRYAYPSYYLEEIRAPLNAIYQDGKDVQAEAYTNAFNAINLGIETPSVTVDVEEALRSYRETPSASTTSSTSSNTSTGTGYGTGTSSSSGSSYSTSDTSEG